MNEQILKTEPAVFSVGSNYQIIVPVNCETLMWVKIADKLFYDHINGTLRSNTNIHRMIVPQSLLDNEKKYSICYRRVIQRKPYFTETYDVQEKVFDFHPVDDNISKCYFIADAHNDSVATVAAVNKFEEKYGEIDFLVLAGDIPNDSGNVENFNTIYEIAGKVTGGRKPIVYAKGNHDLRGIYAEKMEDYVPNLNGKSYFTFKIGNIWGISLDCGEDKNDDNPEYGNTVCCHQFRLEETEFIKGVIKDASKEYLAKDVKYKIIISHNPFSEQLQPPFNIESEIYSEWCKLLKEYVKPNIMMCGHFHRLSVNEIGGHKDHLGQPCRVVVGTKPYRDNEQQKHFIGTGFFFNNGNIDFVFTDDSGNEYDNNGNLVIGT